MKADFKTGLQIANNNVSFSVKIHKSINFITINRLLPKYKDDLFKFINDLSFKTISDECLNNSKYSRIRKFELDDNISEYKPSISVLYNNSGTVFGLGNAITLYYPTSWIIDAFSRFLPQITSPLLKHCPISLIELTIDFYTNDNKLFKEMLDNNSIVRNNKSEPCRYKDTTYSKNTRKLKRSKSTRTYIKTVYPGQPVRYEIVLGTQAVRPLNLSLDNLDSVLSNLDLRDYINFRPFNDIKYKNLLFKRINKGLPTPTLLRRNNLNLKQGLKKQLINSWVDNYLLIEQNQTLEPNTTQLPGFDFAQYEDFAPETAMGILHKLKKGREKNPLYFFKEDKEASDSFFTAINQEGFLL